MKYKTRFLAFFGAMTLFNLASNYAHPVTPTIIQNLGLHDYMFGLALATMMTANFLFSPFWGKINQYISSGRSLCICCIGYGLAQLGFACSTTELSVLLYRLLAGVFVGGIFVGQLTYVVNAAKPEDQGKYLTISATINAVAGAFGYLIGGIYRILRYIETKNVVTLVVGIVCLVTGIGNFAAWIVDLITEITQNKITVLAD